MEDGKNKLLEPDENDDTPQDEQVAALTEALSEEKDARGEERFLFILAFMVVFDVVFFTKLGGWAGPLVIGVLEVIIGLALAERYGVKTVLAWAHRIVDMLKGRHK